MQLLIDLATMAVMHSSGVPLTDLALVRGDKLPLRITLLDDGVPVTPSGVRPALAVKTSLASGTLVLAATNLELVDDALGPAYVGSLSVNTTQLAEAMGQDDRMELVGELVLISGDGSQRTSSLIRVSVRQDIMPTDVVPPQDVITDWANLIGDALTAQLPDALQAAGVNITPVTGSSTLSTGEAETPTVMACYAMSWGDELLAGHLTESCRLRRVTMTYYTDTGLMDAHWMRVWRLEGGKYVVIGLATAVALPANNQPIAWDFAPGVSLRMGDKIMLEICAGQDAAHLTTHGLGVHAVITPAKDGRGLASSVSYPPEITMATMAPMMSVTVAYDEGVSVGGVELATATQVQALGADVRTAAANSQAAAQSTAASRDQAQESAQTASDAATAAQQALAAMPVDANGNITAQGGTFARTVNANGGVNIPVAPVTAGNAVNLAHLPMSLFMPGHPLILLKSLWECYGNVEDTASGIHIKDLASGGFGGVCTRVMQWSDWASTATILTVITMTGGNGANVLIDAAYNPNAGVSITPVTSPDTAFLPNAVQLSLFETRQGTAITGRLVGVDGAVLEFSVPSQRDSHSCVYRVFLLETGSVIKAYLGKFTSGMFDGDADVLDRPVYLGEMPVLNNPRRFCFLGIGGLYGGEGNSFPARIPIISGVCRYYGSWLTHLFPQK